MYTLRKTIVNGVDYCIDCANKYINETAHVVHVQNTCKFNELKHCQDCKTSLMTKLIKINRDKFACVEENYVIVDFEIFCLCCCKLFKSFVVSHSLRAINDFYIKQCNICNRPVTRINPVDDCDNCCESYDKLFNREGYYCH